MLKVEKVATPAVPDSVPLLGFVPIATVTVPVNPVAMLPWASWAVTWTAGVMAAPAVVAVGWTEKTSWVAVPTVMSKPVLVALAGPVAEAISVYPLPVLLMLRVENVATPPTAAMFVVPPSVPLPGFVLIATVTVPV